MLSPHRFDRFAIKMIAVTFGGLLFVASLAYGSEHPTSTPIKHVVVIFQENVSFDHYFATYPAALNSPGEPQFHARPGTPTVNGLSGALLTHNPNLANPFRFSRSQAATCDQDHDYTDEQKAFDGGNMDLFVQTVGNGPGNDGFLICNKTDVMGYFDGNTVTAIWNYAQHFAMNDNSFNTTFGPSSPGAINLISGQTAGATGVKGDTSGDIIAGSLISDAQPAFDNCDTRETAFSLLAAGRTIAAFAGPVKPVCGRVGGAHDGRHHVVIPAVGVVIGDDRGCVAPLAALLQAVDRLYQELLLC